jgi:hypothetical protein
MPTVTGQNVYIASDSVNFRTGEVTKANISYNSGTDKLFFSGDLVFQDPTASITGRLEVSHIEVTGAHNPWAGTDTQYGAIYLSDEGRGLLGNFGGNYARPMITANSNKLTIGSNGTSVIRDIDVHPGNGAGAAMSNFNVFTSGVKRMTITRTGYIGFGGGDADNPHQPFVFDAQGGRMDLLNGSLKIRYVPNNDAITITASVGGEGRILAYDGDTSTPHPLKIAGDYVRFSTSGAGSHEVMRITSDGKVGIGINDPTTAKLRIKGTTNDSSELTLQCIDSTETQTFFVRNDGVVQVTDNYFYVSSNAGAYVQHDLRVRGSLSNDGGALVVGGDVNFDVNTLFVDSTNNRVGIGTTDASGKLDVGGDGANIFLHSADYKIARIQPRGTSADLDKGLFSLFDTTTEAVRIDSASSSWLKGGNVGIGTEGPNALLHVYSAGNGEIEIERDGGALINLQAQATKGVIGTDSNHQLDFKTNAGTRMTIEAGGDVGIGTTAPTAKLEVSGANTFRGVSAFYGSTTNELKALALQFDSTYSGVSNVLRFRQGGSTAGGVAF